MSLPISPSCLARGFPETILTYRRSRNNTMENIRRDHIKLVSMSFDVLDISKVEAVIKGKTVKKQHFGYTVVAPMLFGDFVRGLVKGAVADVKVTPQIKKRADEIQEQNKKSNKATMDRAVKREEEKIAACRMRHMPTCLTSTDINDEGLKKCYDAERKTILLGKSNKADEEVSVTVNETDPERRRYLLVPLTAEWRDKLLSVKGGKVVGHANRVVAKTADGKVWTWRVKGIRAGNVTYSFRTFSATGVVPSKGIVPTYFAVIFTGRRNKHLPPMR